MELLAKERIQRIAGNGISWQDAITLSAKPMAVMTNSYSPNRTSSTINFPFSSVIPPETRS